MSSALQVKISTPDRALDHHRQTQEGKKAQRKVPKVLGSMLTALRISPKNATEIPNDVLRVNVEIPDTPDNGQYQFSQTTTLESTIALLSSHRVDDNQKGLRLILTLTKLNKIVSSPRTNVSKRIVMDDSDGTANQVRTLLLSFICDGIDTDVIPAEDSSVVSTLSDDFCDHIEDSFAEDSSDSDDGIEQPTGRHWGELHCLALRVVINCLEHLSTSQTLLQEHKISIDYCSIFWKRLLEALSTNIERDSNRELCGYSLRCLRLLAALDSKRTLLPMLKYLLLPFILNLKEHGKTNDFPMVHDEATKLIKLLV